MEIETLNKKCREILYFLYGNVERLYSLELYTKETKRLTTVQEEVKKALVEQINKETFMSKIKQSPYIALYLINNPEETLTKETWDSLVKIVIEHSTIETSFKSPLLILLMTKKDLKEDTIKTIYKKIQTIQEQAIPIDLGTLPYDYKYYILRRKETDPDTQASILTHYDQIPCHTLVEKIEEFVFDLNEQLEKHKIKNLKEIQGNKELERDYHYFQIMQKYFSSRSKKEKIY